MNSSFKNSQLYRRLLLVGLLAAILTIRGDGYFPFSQMLSSQTWAWLSATHVLLIAAIIFLFFSNWKLPGERIWQPLFRKYQREINTILVLMSTSAIFVIQLKDARNYQEYYNYNLALFLATIVCAAGLSTWAIWSRHKYSYAALFVASALLFLLPLIYFPVTAHLSDLIPIIEEQLEALTSGENIYQYYLLQNGVLTQAVRQPGTTLSYLPAFLLNIDLRVMSVIFTLLTGFMIAKMSAIKNVATDNKQTLITLLILFLLFPYRHGRADLYEPVYWFLLGLALYFLHHKKLFKFTLVWGLSIFTQVWSWLFTPFVSLYLLKQYGWRTATKYTLMYALLGALLLGIFIVHDPHAYIEHVFNYYQRVRANSETYVMVMFLIPLFTVYDWRFLMFPLQLVGVALTGLIYLKRMKHFGHLLESMVVAIFIFLQFNYLSWNYMYINIMLLMILYVTTSLKAQDFQQ